LIMKINKFALLLFRIKLIKFITVAGILSFFLPMITVQMKQKTVYPAHERYSFKNSLIYFSLTTNFADSIVARDTIIKISGYNFPVFLWKLSSGNQFPDLAPVMFGKYNRAVAAFYHFYIILLLVFTIILVKLVFMPFLRYIFGWIVLSTVIAQTAVVFLYNVKASPIDFCLNYGFYLNILVYLLYGLILISMGRSNK